MRIAAVIPAAGRGKRLGTKKAKPFVMIHGRPILIHTLKNLKLSHPFYETILVAAPARVKETENLLKRFRLTGVRVVAGGRSRAESVRKGVFCVSEDSGWVLIHDVARPFADKRLIRQVVRKAMQTGAAVCALPARDTVKRVNLRKKIVCAAEDRRTLYLVQTPQVFKKELLLERYRSLGRRALKLTDESSLFDGTKVAVKVVPGQARNIKITTPEDVRLAEFYLGGNAAGFKA